MATKFLKIGEEPKEEQKTILEQYLFEGAWYRKSLLPNIKKIYWLMEHAGLDYFLVITEDEQRMLYRGKAGDEFK